MDLQDSFSSFLQFFVKDFRNALANESAPAGDQKPASVPIPKPETTQPQEAATQSKPAPPSDDALAKQNANRIINLNPAKNATGK